MKRVLLIVLTLHCAAIFSQKDATTYYFIRHAEKDRSLPENKNPSLNEAGKLRAKKWATIFKEVPFDMIYSSNYKRTIETASPTAESKNLTIQTYDPRVLNSKEFQTSTLGKTVLVVGHSNTTAAFANLILKENLYKPIDDNNNANLYIVSISENHKSSTLLVIN